MQSEQINELVTALVKVQLVLKPAIKNAKNPFFKSDYADLNSVMDSCRELLAANGLVIIQYILVHDGKNALVTRLAHSSGQWIEGAQLLNPVKDDPQSVHSCQTYARRYGVLSILSMGTEDDDGNAASQDNGNVIYKQGDKLPSVAPDNTRPGICGFGKNKGKPWATMNAKQLQWYDEYFCGQIADEEAHAYKARNIAALNEVRQILKIKGGEEDGSN